jgi:hypothetical protein
MCVVAIVCLAKFVGQFRDVGDTGQDGHGTLHDIKVTIDEESVGALRTHPKENVPARCQVGGSAEFPVLVRLKGTSTFETIDGRPNFTVKPRIRDDSRRPGIFSRKFYLHNSKADPSLLRDKFARTVFARLNVDVPQLGFANVSLNGRSMGLYTVAEGITKEFLAERFGSDEGPLFEGDHRDSDVLFGRLECIPESSKTNSTTHDGLLSGRDAGSFENTNLRAFIAGEYLTGHEDGWLFNRNNYWLYRSPARGRLYVFPHTMDSVFRRKYPFIAFRADAQAPQALLMIEAERQEVLSLIRQQCSPTNLSWLLANLQSEGSNLLNSIATRSPAAAMETCVAYQKLTEKVTNHLAHISAALEIEDGRRAVLGYSKDPGHWELKPGSTNCSLSKRTTSPMLFIHAEGESAIAVLECQETVRAGMYRFTSWIRPESLTQEVWLGAGRFGYSSATAQPGWQRVSHEFKVPHPPSGGLFRLETVFLRFQATNFTGRITIDIGRTALDRISND